MRLWLFVMCMCMCNIARSSRARSWEIGGGCGMDAFWMDWGVEGMRMRVKLGLGLGLGFC